MTGIKITAEEFDRACREWASGNYTLAQLSKRYGLRPEWLSQKFKKAKVTKGQDVKIAREAQRRSVEIAIADAAVELKKHTVDAMKYPLTGSIGVMRKALHIFQTAIERGESLSSKDEEFKALLNLMKILETGRKITSDVLKLDKEEVAQGDLPVLEIIKMTEQDVIEERARQMAEDAAISGAEFADLPMLGEYDPDAKEPSEGEDEDDSGEIVDLSDEAEDESQDS